MNIKLWTLISILSLSLIFGFEKISYGFNQISQDNISELKILNYLPENNKTFFISNTKSSIISNNLIKNYETKEKDELVLIKNSILAYLGIDLGINQLEDIYNDELVISFYGNKEKDIDDVLIIFKIKEKKDIDDILNLSNKIDEPNKMIKIFRKNKLNYLKYIYRTRDNYIITSSNKSLILDALHSSNISKKNDAEYNSLKEVINNFKSENNILFTKNFKPIELFDSEDYSLTQEDYIVTLFNIKDKKINLKSYLLNSNKNLDISSYKKLDKDDLLDKKKYIISIHNNLLNPNQYLNDIKINNFEKAIFKELNEKLHQNILFLISEKNWVIIFDRNSLPIEKIELLEDFNKNSLDDNDNIYTIFSKDKLKKEDNAIKTLYYKKIFSIQSDRLTFVSNSLINKSDIDLIANEFLNFKGDSQAKYFLNKKINLKNPYPIEPKNISYLKNINYFFKNVINLSILEFTEILKQSIPETVPIYYAETNLKIF